MPVDLIIYKNYSLQGIIFNNGLVNAIIHHAVKNVNIHQYQPIKRLKGVVSIKKHEGSANDENQYK